ncbi:hypothetical protein C1I97_23200 [Streptomyces sp. NTH33]|uniref:hypothetical protein n=1 Tax=Streptomyces sp. NTH33 TaxID=1735453 RepID=UPI000DAA371A|nr:hypothetical protein [Streptomyces sp. NTH33]PZH00544.1 hypothetical protein C1I97_23200 [Streptomyces sp. NTH33]
MPVPRSPAVLVGIAMLGMALTACEENAQGMIEGRSGAGVVEMISNPPVHACHRFREGVTHVTNYTQSNIMLYRTADCTEPASGQAVYLDRRMSDQTAPSSAPWRSFSIVS